MERIYNLLTGFLKSGFGFQDLFLISNIFVAIETNKRINAKDLHLKCPNNSSISTIHRRLNLLREKGIIDYSLDYVDGRKTFITKGSNFKSTMYILQTVIDRNIKTYMNSSPDK